VNSEQPPGPPGLSAASHTDSHNGLSHGVIAGIAIAGAIVAVGIAAAGSAGEHLCSLCTSFLWRFKSSAKCLPVAQTTANRSSELLWVCAAMLLASRAKRRRIGSNGEFPAPPPSKHACISAVCAGPRMCRLASCCQAVCTGHRGLAVHMCCCMYAAAKLPSAQHAAASCLSDVIPSFCLQALKTRWLSWTGSCGGGSSQPRTWRSARGQTAAPGCWARAASERRAYNDLIDVWKQLTFSFASAVLPLLSLSAQGKRLQHIYALISSRGSSMHSMPLLHASLFDLYHVEDHAVQVYKGLLRGVQEVAIKQLRHAGAADLEKFLDVGVDAALLPCICFPALQYGSQLHARNSLLVLQG
jgi:hypothetical protein